MDWDTQTDIELQRHTSVTIGSNRSYWYETHRQIQDYTRYNRLQQEWLIWDTQTDKRHTDIYRTTKAHVTIDSNRSDCMIYMRHTDRYRTDYTKRSAHIFVRHLQKRLIRDTQTDNKLQWRQLKNTIWQLLSQTHYIIDCVSKDVFDSIHFNDAIFSWFWNLDLNIELQISFDSPTHNTLTQRCVYL
jgi:hypothetical protein